MASPINPADVNQIQGTYPKLPRFEEGIGFIPGNEGVAQVSEVGSDVKDIKVGDRVIPSGPAFGFFKFIFRHLEDIYNF